MKPALKFTPLYEKCPRCQLDFSEHFVDSGEYKEYSENNKDNTEYFIFTRMADPKFLIGERISLKDYRLKGMINPLSETDKETANGNKRGWSGWKFWQKSGSREHENKNADDHDNLVPVVKRKFRERISIIFWDGIHFDSRSHNKSMLLTNNTIRAYPNPVTAKSVIGFDSPEKAANSRNVSSNAVFLRLVSPFMGGLDGEPQGSPVRFPGLSTRLVPPTCLTAGVRLNQLNESEHIMTNIIPVVSRTFHGKPTPMIEAERLCSFLSITTRFDTWFNRRISEYGFEENSDYVSFEQKCSKPSGGRPSRKYFLTIDMAKELAMVERTEKGREARRYFIECEKQLKEKQQAKALPNPEKKRYNYPRHLLEQEHFTSPTKRAPLSISMLGHEKEFSSSLLELLLELRMDGHNVDAPYAEYMAMREGLIKARRALDEIMQTALRASAQPASTAGN